VIFDVTHSLQLPGGGQGETAGERRFAEPLARAAVAAGAAGIFMEVHPNPDAAKSDRATQLSVPRAEALAISLLEIHRTLQANVPLA
jgi:2-dehydro-3-deoxyphosphooctonate aldolase (KDO 8-P synthase)